MKLIDENLLNEVCLLADKSPRHRMNFNFHPNESDSFNRLLNAMNPETKFPIHRHLNPDRDESCLVLKGSLIVYLYDNEGNVIFEQEINPKKEVYGIDIPAHVWHTFVVLEPGTVVYEAKPGPFVPLTPDNIAPWDLSYWQIV